MSANNDDETTPTRRSYISFDDGTQGNKSKASKDPLPSTSAHHRDDANPEQDHETQLLVQRPQGISEAWDIALSGIIQLYKSRTSIIQIYFIIRRDNKTFRARYPRNESYPCLSSSATNSSKLQRLPAENTC